MHQARTFCSTLLAAALVAYLAPPASAQDPQATTGAAQAAGASAQELYHAHFVKAAPGKLTELISAYKEAPVPENEPGRPIILRHMQGDDWDLLVLSPLGKEETVKPTGDAETQQWAQRTRPLRSEHADTFTSGPPWAEVQRSLGTAGGSGAAATGTSGVSGGAASTAAAEEGPVYVVTTYRSLPGHRDQLADSLRRVTALFPDRRTILQHVEGAPWEFVLIERFDSWGAIGDQEAVPPERLRSQGFANQEAIALELREHAAEHHDTIARMVR